MSSKPSSDSIIGPGSWPIARSNIWGRFCSCVCCVSLGVPSRRALLFAVLYLFNPAFLNFGFVYPGFQFDVFASVLLLAAFWLLLEYRYGFALALIAAAVS